MRVTPLTYGGQAIDADAIVPLRPTGRNEPYAFVLQSRDARIVLAADPLNRIAVDGRDRPVKRRAGFTLVEILVALAIVAIALTAGMRALAQATETASALKARTLALWVAQNRLAAAQVASPWPALGSTQGEAEQAGAAFVWQARVSTTPNPAFRMVEITVAEPQVPDYVLARLVGFLGNPAPRP